MLSSFFYVYKKISIIVIIICVLFIPLICNEAIYANLKNINEINDELEFDEINNEFKSDLFIWPIPGYDKISSNFGLRKSPTAGASTFHSGIDIPAPEGTKLYAIDDGKVTFAGWGAGGGYTVTIQLVNYPELKFSFCHVSPIMLVTEDDIVKRGDVIARVGPKNVYGINNNQYRDANNEPTNGATTGCHLHFIIKKNNIPTNPMNFYKN